jgi:16S rRNA (uracil1498-N3)-methyltransferase
MQLFFNADIDENTQQLAFSRDESKHIVKVLRKSVGDKLELTNGKGWLFEAEITIADLKNCITVITSKTFQKRKNYSLHLAVAPTKMNDRYEWFIEKATEIGIDTITPIVCDHSERKIIKTDRFEKILQSAMKQSLQNYKPHLNEPVLFKDFVEQKIGGIKFIAHCEETNRKSLKAVIKPKEDVTILIGPEGDFSTKEIQLAIAAGFIPVMMGNTRLRTETAAIVACHSVAYSNET